MKKLQSNKGFTLVELIIVIAILAIIMLIAIPNFSGIQQRMQVRADKATAAQIGKAVRIWYTEYNSDPAFKASTLAKKSTVVPAKEAPASLASTTTTTESTVNYVEALPHGATAMAHLCQVPSLISYVDTTLVPSSLVDSNNVKVDKQYYYVGITGSGTGEKIVVAISGATAPDLIATALTQSNVLYDGNPTPSPVPSTQNAVDYSIAYIEP